MKGNEKGQKHALAKMQRAPRERKAQEGRTRGDVVVLFLAIIAS